MTKKNAVKSTYDQWSSNYNSYIVEEKKFAEEAAYYGDIFKKHGVRSVHDLGCGTGRHTTYFAEMGYAAEGSDLSHGMLDQARERAKEKGLDINFVQATFQEVKDKASQKVDGALCAGLGIAHLVDEKDLTEGLQSIYELLNPGGVVIFENRRLEDLVNDEKKAHFGPLQVHQTDGRQELGFRVLQHNGDHTVTYNVLSFQEEGEGEWTHTVRSFSLWLGITPKLQELLPKIGFSDVQVIHGVEFLPQHGTTDLTIAVK